MVELLQSGEIVSIAPGGVREALFSINYSLVWKKRVGFAKAALEAEAVLIAVIYFSQVLALYADICFYSLLWKLEFATTLAAGKKGGVTKNFRSTTSKTTWRAKLKFGHDVGAYECFMQTELEAPGHVTKILRAKNGQKVGNFNRYISIITDIDEKWFVIFEHTINCLFFGYVR